MSQNFHFLFLPLSGICIWIYISGILQPSKLRNSNQFSMIFLPNFLGGFGRGEDGLGVGGDVFGLSFLLFLHNTSRFTL